MSLLFSNMKKNPSNEHETPDRSDYIDLQERVHLGTARMKTHFMGNIASALYHLCEADPEQAQESLLALFGYLRQNVESINRRDMLPFTWELRHAQNYLTLETLRFENRMQVYTEADIEDFNLPALTIQPLVENAVKHGLAPVTGRTTTIGITCRKLPDGSIQLQVTDDGAGFDTAILEEDEYSQKSLACIRSRLKKEVGGSLQIESRPGHGTTATVIIPKTS